MARRSPWCRILQPCHCSTRGGGTIGGGSDTAQGDERGGAHPKRHYIQFSHLRLRQWRALGKGTRPTWRDARRRNRSEWQSLQRVHLGVREVHFKRTISPLREQRYVFLIPARSHKSTPRLYYIYCRTTLSTTLSDPPIQRTKPWCGNPCDPGTSVVHHTLS